MGLLARTQTDRVAFAAAKAISDTRRHSSIAFKVVTGTLTLVAGTLAVTGQGITANAIITMMLTTPGGTAGTAYKFTGIGTSGGFTVTAVSTTGTTVATDTSTFTWMAEMPLFHGDQTPQYETGDVFAPGFVNLTVTAATAADLPTTITLANQQRQVLLQHLADAVAHVNADTTNRATLAAVPVATDLPSVQTLLNQIKASHNASLTQANVHVNNDTLNTVATANATDLASSQTLANALTTAINAHLGSAPVGESVTVIPD